MTTQFFKRPAGAYTGEAGLPNRTKYFTDSTSSPKVPISSQKIDGDINYLVDAVNELYDTAVTGTLPDNSVTNAKLRDSSACSVIGRSANSSGDPADIVAATNDTVLVRKANTVAFGSVPTAGIDDGAITTVKVADTNITFAKIQNVNTATIIGRTSSGSGSLEALTAGAGIVVSGGTVAASAKNPTRQVFTSGSGTYTRPTGCTFIKVRMIGGGGGGGGLSGTGGTGGTTTFGSFTAIGGSGGPSSTNSVGGVGGTGGTGTASVRVAGGRGGNVFVTGTMTVLGSGASSPFGGGGQPPAFSPAANGGNAATNSGSGGGGAASGSTGAAGAGGGAGEYVELEITTPTTSYSYAVGAGGTAGSGTNTGGAGGSGVIIVDEYYY